MEMKQKVVEDLNKNIDGDVIHIKAWKNQDGSWSASIDDWYFGNGANLDEAVDNAIKDYVHA